MLKWISFATAVIMTVSVSFAQNATQRQTPFILDGVAAEVGGARITIADTMAAAKELAAARKTMDPAYKTDIRALYAESLTNLVNRQLILNRYEKAEQKLPAWYLNQRIEGIIEEHFGGDRSKLVSMLNSRGIGYAAWSKKIEEDVIINTMRQQFVEQNVIIRPDDILSAYERKYAAKKLDGPVRVAMILLKSNDKTREAALAEARELVTDIRNGGDFAALARKLSKEDHAGNGGDWGYITPADELRKELADALAGLKIGGVSEPVYLADGLIYILKKVDERADLKIPLDFVRAEIEHNLRAKAADARYDEWVKSLANDITVRMYPLP